jgi:hypothetical protein
MKHLRVVTKQTPAQGYWWQWYLQIKTSGALTIFVNALFGTPGGFDVRNV